MLPTIVSQSGRTISGNTSQNANAAYGISVTPSGMASMNAILVQ
jgi:hypothetical protein